MNITSPKTHHNRNMMKEFTPPRLCLLGPVSNGMGLSIMLKMCKMMFLKCSNASKPCSNESRMSKNGHFASFCTQFGRKLEKLWPMLVSPLFTLQFAQNPTPTLIFSPFSANRPPNPPESERTFRAINFGTEGLKSRKRAVIQES